jgi:hypothetical protein
MAGRTPKKAKAAFQGKAASLLLPHMVDELPLYIGPMSRSVNGAADRIVAESKRLGERGAKATLRMGEK